MATIIDTKAVELFYSYSHKDELLRNELEKHLSILSRQGIISEWHDRKIIAGEEWENTIDQHLRSASIILLLVSSDFLASEYCYGKELKVALERHEKGEARVIPVIIRSVDWSSAPFGKLQALPKDAKSVTSWEDRDEAFTNIVQGIRSAISEVVKSPKKAIASDPSDLLKQFSLRPKKYRGKEFISDIKLDDRLSSVDISTANCLGLAVGDAIERRFTIINSSAKFIGELCADGKMADWLEESTSGNYKVRIRLLFGSYDEEQTFHGQPFPGELFTTYKTGYRLVEVIEQLENQNENISKKLA